MTVNRTTSAGDNRTTSAAANRIHTGALVGSTATRMTLTNARIRRERSMVWCPTCGTKQQRDGRLGALNHPGYCNALCYSSYRRQHITRVLNSSGNRDGSIFTLASVPPGGVS